MLRVTQIVPAISNRASGPSYSVVALCKSLISHSVFSDIVTLDWDGRQSDYDFVKQFEIGVGLKRLGRSPAMYNYLHKIVKNKYVDILHNHSLWMMPNIYPGFVTRKFDVPYIVSPRGSLSEWALSHGSIFKKIVKPLLQFPSLERANCFHATSYAEYKDIRRCGFRQPVAVIPNGVDLPNIFAKKQKSLRTLLFLGRIHPKKGLDILLLAWSEIHHLFPDWRLLIVGDDNGGYYNKIRQLATELNLTRVTFSGPLYGEEKWNAFNESDLFILPTHSENFGLAVAEALASGTPAIVSHGAPWEGLESRNAGWWIGIGLEELVSCLKVALSQSSVTLNKMGLRGRDWMLSDFSWDSISVKMSKTYLWILNGGVKPSWIIKD